MNWNDYLRMNTTNTLRLFVSNYEDGMGYAFQNTTLGFYPYSAMWWEVNLHLHIVESTCTMPTENTNFPNNL